MFMSVYVPIRSYECIIIYAPFSFFFFIAQVTDRLDDRHGLIRQDDVFIELSALFSVRNIFTCLFFRATSDHLNSLQMSCTTK